MIARIWRGLTPISKSEAYLKYLEATGLKDYRATEGNRGVFILQRVEQDYAEFTLVSFWESWEAIRRFAGEDYERAVYYPEDEAFLVTKKPFVSHYEVPVASLAGAPTADVHALT